MPQWKQQLKFLADRCLTVSDNILATTRDNLTTFNARVSFAATRPLTAKRLHSCAIEIPDAPGLLKTDSLLAVLRCRGIVLSDLDWQALVDEIRESRGVVVPVVPVEQPIAVELPVALVPRLNVFSWNLALSV